MYAKATSCVKKTFEKLPDEGYIGNDDEEQHIDSSAPMQSLISPKKELQQQRHIDFDLQSYFSEYIGNMKFHRTLILTLNSN